MSEQNVMNGTKCNKDGWVKKQLGEVCDKASSNVAQNKIKELTGEYSIYGASGYIQNVDFYHRKMPYLGVVKDGSGVGRVNKYPAYSSLLGTMQYIIPKDGCHLSFLEYTLKSLDLASFATGAAIPHIYFKDYSKCIVYLPPLEEQQRIVSELDCLNGIIEKQKEQLKQLDELAQSIFYDMFGDPVENEKGWEIKEIQDVGTLGRGVSKHRPRNAPELLGGLMPLIQTGDIANSGMFIRKYTSTYSDMGVAQSKVWNQGTLCITIAATIGKCAITTFQVCFPDSVVGFINSKDIVDIIYIYFIFCSLQKILEEEAPAVAQKNINLKVLNKLKIPVPPLSLQQSFAQKIEAIEHQKELIKKSIAETEILFNSRMDYYFG